MFSQTRVFEQKTATFGAKHVCITEKPQHLASIFRQIQLVCRKIAIILYESNEMELKEWSFSVTVNNWQPFNALITSL